MQQVQPTMARPQLQAAITSKPLILGGSPMGSPLFHNQIKWTTVGKSNDCGEMQIVLRLFESRAKVSYWVAIS